jgi:antitoxin PrlF
MEYYPVILTIRIIGITSMAYSSRITSKGQVTVPQEIRRRLGLRKGDRVEFVVERGRTFIRRDVGAAGNPFSRYAGAFPAFPGGIREINSWVRRMRDEDAGD